MRYFSLIIYFLTLLCVVVDLFLIHYAFSPEKAQVLVNLGVLKSTEPHSFARFLIFVMVFSLISSGLLIISFIIITKKLLFNGYKFSYKSPAPKFNNSR